MIALFLASALAAGTATNPWAQVHDPVAGADGKAEVFGTHSLGCFRNGVEVPPSGEFWEAVNIQRRHHFGHPQALEFIKELGRWSVEEAKFGKLLIGDLSQPAGGPMTTMHASHQLGLDIDIRYRFTAKALTDDERVGFKEYPVAWHELDAAGGKFRLDSRLTDEWRDSYGEIVRKAAQHPRVERIFASPPIKKALCAKFKTKDEDGKDAYPAWLVKVRPYWEHNAHFHVRLACPADSPSCKKQDAIVVDKNDVTKVGCAGPDLEQWFETDPNKPGYLQDEVAAYKARGGKPKPQNQETDWREKLDRMPAPCKALLKASQEPKRDTASRRKK